MGLLAILGALATPFQLVVDRVSKWSERRDKLTEAKLGAELAKITAEAELAAYKVKADVEWDLAWAGQAQASWKDEYILVLWTIPMLTFLPALFIPTWRDNFVDTMQFVQNLFGPDILYWYMGGWGVIFSATFGMKSALQFMVPGNVGKIAAAFQQLPDDIPDGAAAAVTEGIKERLAGKVGLF